MECGLRGGSGAASAGPEAGLSARNEGRFLYGYLLGALRAPIVGLHWIKVDLAYREGRFDAIEKDLRALAELNPYSERVWDYAAWHQAFNVAGRSRSVGDRFARRLEGLRLVRAGLALRPDSRLLLVRLGQVSRALRETDAARYARVTAERPPEAEVFEGYRRMLTRPETVPEDLVFLAGAALDWSVRVTAEGRPGEAGPVLEVGRRALARYRSIAAGADPPAGSDPSAEGDRGLSELARALAAWGRLAAAVGSVRVGDEGAGQRAREAIRAWRALGPEMTADYRSVVETIEHQLDGSAAGPIRR